MVGMALPIHKFCWLHVHFLVNSRILGIESTRSDSCGTMRVLMHCYQSVLLLIVFCKLPSDVFGSLRGMIGTHKMSKQH